MLKDPFGSLAGWSQISEFKDLKKLQPSGKYLELYGVLKKEFHKRREIGAPVDFNWLWMKAGQIYKVQHGTKAIVKKHVIISFIKRYRLKMRRVQRNKKHAKESFREEMQRWHANLRQRIIRSGANTFYDARWGHFLPSQRLNVDQSPLPFAIDTSKTYEIPEPGKKVWVAQPNPGASKRFCSLNTCFRPEGTQPRLSIIFRGQGLRISNAERKAWDAG